MSVAWAQTPVDVVFTHHGVVAERCVRVDDECYAPLDFLKSAGWEYTTRGDAVEVRADGQKARVELRTIGGRAMLPLRRLMTAVGGETSWDGDRLLALAPLEQVTIENGRFRIESALAVQPHIELLDSPNRIVVDLQGARLTRKTVVSLDGTARIAQFKPDVVRVVLESDFNPDLAKRAWSPGTSFAFSAQGEAPPTAPTKPPRTPLTQVQEIQYDAASDPDMAPPVQVVNDPNQTLVGPLTIDSDSGKIAGLTLKISNGLQKMPTFRRPEPDQCEIVIPKARVADGIDFGVVKGETIKDVATRDEGGNLVLALTLARPMGIEFSLSASGLQIQLIKPEVGNGKLAGKVIVVDPGHGGHDHGTESAGISEKDLTLKISRMLSQKLAREGATVIMTRKTDVFISLNERPAQANRNKADFFISVHINSNEVDNTASGSITFFHAKDPICQLLADCIQREVVKVNKIGGMGVWSDQRIYNSGFAVLRGAKMPAVLVECGFLNTKKDRARMITSAFQEAVAGAIVEGLKVYLGDEKKD